MGKAYLKKGGLLESPRRGVFKMKGVFITTSAYTAEATQYAAHIDTKVVLIDGKQLSNLMIDFELGVSPLATFTVKRLDYDRQPALRFRSSDAL